MSDSGSQDGYESPREDMTNITSVGTEFRPLTGTKEKNGLQLPAYPAGLERYDAIRTTKTSSARSSARYTEPSLTPTSPPVCTDETGHFDRILDGTAKQAGLSLDQSPSQTGRNGDCRTQGEVLSLANWRSISGDNSRDATSSDVQYLEGNATAGELTGANPWTHYTGFSSLLSESRRQDHLKPATVNHYTPQNISESSKISRGHVIFSYYPFLEMDTMSQMSSDAVNFLEIQQCFRIPTPGILDEFVREYFLHVHPNVPMLDEGAFWEFYRPSRSRPPHRSRISLFVFRAMLFACCSFVSLDTVQKLGFLDIRSARGAYYQAAKALFQFDEGRDAISTAQGVLLLSYYTSDNSGKENTYWLGLAIHFAREAGAHQYHLRRQSSTKQRNILKRLWWCCILRDRVISLGLRRPLQISSEEFDFSVPAFLMQDFEDEIGLSNVYDQVTKRALVQIIVSLSELAVGLTDVIMVVCPRKELSNLPSKSDLERSYCLIESCKANLGCWYERTRERFSRIVGIDNAHQSLKLYTNLTYIYYFSAKVALYNYTILLSAPHYSSADDHWDQRYKSKHDLQEGLIGITEILKELMQLKLSKYLPISIVAYAVLPLLMHVLDVQLSTTVSQRATTQPRLDIYIRAMEAFQAQYDGTDKALEIVGKLADNMSFECQTQRSQKEIGTNMRITQEHRLLSDVAMSPARDTRRLVVYDWGDILLRQPTCYVRLAMAIDFCLCYGRIPHNADFPDHLQFQDQGTQLPMFRIITTRIEAAAHEELGDSRITSLDESTRPEIDNPNRPANDDSLDGHQDRYLETDKRDSAQTPESTDLQEYQSPAPSEQPLDYTAFDVLMLESEISAPDESSFWADEALLMDFPAV